LVGDLVGDSVVIFVGDLVGDVVSGMLWVVMLKNSMRVGSFSLATERRKIGATNQSDKAGKTQNVSRMLYVGAVTKREHTRSSRLQNAKLTVGSKIRVRLEVDRVPAWISVKATQSSRTTLSFAFLREYATKRGEQEQRCSHVSVFLPQLSFFAFGSLFVVRNNSVTAM
jgi:hypothetical protein